MGNKETSVSQKRQDLLVQQQQACGDPYLPAQSGVTYGSDFETGEAYAARNAQLVLSATKEEVVSGYPLSSYVNIRDAKPVPPHLGVCLS